MNRGRLARRIRPVASRSDNGAHEQSAASSSILSVEQLTVSFDGFTVLDELDFQMGYGEMRFLIGPNGATFLAGESFETHQQVFVNREVGEDVPALGNITETGFGAAVGSPPRKVGFVERNAA